MERLSLSDALTRAEAYAGRPTVTPGGRFARVRRLEALVTWPLLRRQLKYNTAVADALRQLKSGLDAMSSSGSASTRQAYASHHEGIASLRRDMVALQQQVNEFAHRLDAVSAQSRAGQAHVDLFLNEVRHALPEPPPAAALAALPQAWDGLYATFEEMYRGSFEDIRGRFKPYLEDLPAPGRTPEGAPVLDVGTGRGEWLSLLKEAGIPAYGVDSNPEVAARAAEVGVDVRPEEALEHLRGVAERSLSAVTAFHVAEHLELDQLIELLDLALRALAPGGRLIMETPNPDNLAVGASSFYLDPTHRHPLPPPLLEFLVTARGFADVEIRPLHRHDPPIPLPAEPGPVQEIARILNSHLGAAEDYAVLASRL
ncbi:MAG: class I SAM-dependent methyltransferase [Mycobacteriales bacterium]